MSSLSTGNQQAYSMAGRKADTQWSGTFRSLSMNISAVLISLILIFLQLIDFHSLFPLTNVQTLTNHVYILMER